MANSNNGESIDLWKSFESEEGLKPGKTDGSQWTGKYDRRKQPRDEDENGSTQSNGDYVE